VRATRNSATKRKRALRGRPRTATLSVVIPEELARSLDDLVAEVRARFPEVELERESAARWLLESMLRGR
jgi:DNA-binding transcriptional LysR family regulator